MQVCTAQTTPEVDSASLFEAPEFQGDEDSLYEEYYPPTENENSYYDRDNYQKRADIPLPAGTSLDKELWKELADNQDFSKRKAEKNEKPVSKIQPIKIPDWQPNFNFSVLKYVFIFLLLSVLLWQSWLAYKRTVNRSTDKVEDFNIEIENIENQLTNANVETPLQEALRNKWFAQALRLYHLKNLQLMDKNRFIQWQKHKTNRQYGYEIGNRDIRSQYFQLTAAYEQFWFGNTILDESTFQRIEAQFLQFFNKTNRYVP